MLSPFSAIYRFVSLRAKLSEHDRKTYFYKSTVLAEIMMCLFQMNRWYEAMNKDVDLTYPKIRVLAVRQCDFIFGLLFHLQNFCGSCQKKQARSKCSKCLWARYCDAKCQKDHWKTHKKKFVRFFRRKKSRTSLFSVAYPGKPICISKNLCN